MIAVDREELIGKLLWVQENLGEFDNTSKWTQRMKLAILKLAQGGEIVIPELSEDEAEELLDLCDAAAEASGFTLVAEPPSG